MCVYVCVCLGDTHVRYGTIRYDTVRYGTIRYDTYMTSLLNWRVDSQAGTR